MSKSDLRGLAARFGLAEPAVRALDAVLSGIANDPHSPTSQRARAEALDTHIADSLAGLELAEVRDGSVVADLGSGAGLPGLVLAAALPGASFRMVESQAAKCAFISSLIAAAGLENAQAINARAEAWPAGVAAHDLVVARALAAQPVVLEYAAPLLALGGRLVEWRGARSAEEEERASAAAGELGLTLKQIVRVEPFAGARERHLHVFEKTSPTPERFPRRPGIARKRPLGGRASS